jgi:hypothetical protein
MYAHEALLMGSMIIKPERGVYLTLDRSRGCAIGMINVASDYNSRTKYSWMMGLNRSPLPCGCKGMIMGGGGQINLDAGGIHSYEVMIVHLFNQHVCDGSWSIERLADWIKSADPTIALDSPQKEIKLQSTGEPDERAAGHDSERTDPVQVMVGFSG